jgi:hypothetical protein
MKLGDTLKVDTEQFPLREQCNSIIGAFKEEGITCYLAGGWLRDHVLGKEGKDLDFFLRDNQNKSCWLREEGLFELLGFDLAQGDTYKWAGQQYSQMTLTIVCKGVTYQFIYVGNEPASYIKLKFDYSINQIYYDGTDIHITPAFKKTLKTKQVIEVYRNPAVDNVRRRKYLMEKFPEFTFPAIDYKSSYDWSATTVAGKKVSAQQFYNQLAGLEVVNPPNFFDNAA